MLTELEIRIWTCVWTVGQKFVTIPFEWKGGTVLLKKRQRLFCQLLAWTLHLTMFSHRVAQLPKLIAKRNISGIILHGIVTFAASIGLVAKINVWMHKKEIIRVVNQMFHLNSVWGKRFLKRQSLVSPIREKALATMLLLILSAPVFELLVLIGTRNEDYSYYGMIRVEDHQLTSILVFLLFVSSEAFICAEIAINFFLNVITIYFCCLTMNFWLHKICIDWPKQENELPETCLVHYKGIYVLNDDFNFTFGKLIIPYFKLIFSCGFMVSFFALVRLSNDLDLLALLMMISAAVGTCSIQPVALIMSSMFDLSTQFSRNLTSAIQPVSDTKTRNVLKAGLKSCALIRCQVGSLYHMETQARITLIQQIINGTVFLLINVKI